MQFCFFRRNSSTFFKVFQRKSNLLFQFFNCPTARRLYFFLLCFHNWAKVVHFSINDEFEWNFSNFAV